VRGVFKYFVFPKKAASGEKRDVLSSRDQLTCWEGFFGLNLKMEQISNGGVRARAFDLVWVGVCV